ncbi:NAD-dependent epimerase/dehydratase family protein [Curtobacterium ammoniigenes]|uniref:NAD-dependent epimerase/dehydratase family protein n=1 Tax=Curtobacterium ammoniigenes TaxID=395387 RepID=UPI0008356B9A|nr:hypothetical protein [Curtobacterium ammoniigenes]
MSTRRAVIFGTGGIGSAVARELLGTVDASTAGSRSPDGDSDDWTVEIVARHASLGSAELERAGATFVGGDRRDTALLRELLRPGADLVVDTVCATRGDAAQLLPYAGDVGSLVMISSKAVYIDEQGRHANSVDKPVFAGPITELQPTVHAGDGDPTGRDGYSANKVAAEELLLDSDLPTTVLRPSKVYGVGIGRPREWFVVRRVLDGRERIALADGGRGQDHTTAAAGIASLARIVADQPGRRILNVADRSAPTARDIVRSIAAHLDHRFEEFLLDETAPAFLGLTPWSAPHPFILDTAAAEALGWNPPQYEQAVRPELDWLVETARSTPASRDVPWASDPFWDRLFDYGPEDAALTLLALQQSA